MADSSRTPSSSTSQGQAAALSKAQQFEDEKRRIMQSCFNKIDPTDGSLLESYITHCRVIEEGSGSEKPSNPGEVDPDSIKPRVIMVAVRKSGRVRMHKARENSNGSFSIGKTWNLDDLQTIKNYGPPHERGFTVTILKPYYWQANSAKEKDFFISSLVKIFKKYTAGKLPILEGFKQSELDAFAGGSSSHTSSKSSRQDDSHRMPKTPTSTGFSSTAPVDRSTSRSVSATHSTDTLNKPPRPTGLVTAKQDSRSASMGGLTSPSAMTRQKSSDILPGRRTPSDDPPSRRATASPPPIPTPSPAPQHGRRPSESSSRSASSRVASSSLTAHQSEDERDSRRAGSQDAAFRSPSTSSSHSKDSRRAGMLPTAKPQPPPEESPAPPASQTNPPIIAYKRSNRDVASTMRLAANTYIAGSKLNTPQSRPRTPTTPTHSSSLAREAANMTSPPDAPPPSIPAALQTGHPPQGRPSMEQPNGNGSVYSGRPSLDGRRSRASSISNSSRDQVPVAASEPAPLAPKEPPPRSEARGRQPPSRENSQSKITLPSGPKPLAPLEPASLMIKKPPQTSVPTAIVSPPKDTPSDEPTEPKEKSSLPTSIEALHAPAQRPRSRSPGTRSRRRQSMKSSTYLDGLDRSKLSMDIDALLQEFHWNGQNKLDVLQADVRKELARVESSNVVVSMDDDDRINQLSELLDKAIQECEEMDGLLTLYAVELSSLNDDITHIENQSQGLQLQTANQKTLQKELQTLLDTITISPTQIDVLKHGSLETARGLEQVEQTLLSLYRAIKTIEPSGSIDPMSPRGVGRRGSFSDAGVGTMRALQERKEEYRTSCRTFLGRLRQFLNIKFQAELLEIKKDGTVANINSGVRPRMIGHDKAYQNLWKFAGLIAFARDVDGDEYMEIRRLYEKPSKQIIQDEIREHISAWKKITKKTSTDEQEMLVFTTPEKEDISVSSSLTAARKLTVKKSIARIRTGGGSFIGGDRPVAGIINAYEAFSGAFGEIYQLVFKEQNFLVEFFHLSSRNSTDFGEFISHGSPDQRNLKSLTGLKAVEPDKLKAKLIYEFMGQIFSFLMQELQLFSDWATINDATQGVGVMYALEQKMATVDETDQEFLFKTMQKLHDRMVESFAKFLDEQVKAIEETKVKIKKRKGVINFMRIFPIFAARIEEQMPYANTNNNNGNGKGDLDVREMVNEGYKNINKTMFDSLQAIAKESPQFGGQVDPEDKEQLNYHIMMIENMHHYLEEVDTKGNGILEDFRKKAEEEYKEHMGLYINAVIRRPLAKLLDYVENVEALVKAGTDDIPNRSSTNKAVFKKVLDHHEGKDIKKGIEALKKRVDKHFGEGDDPALSDKLVVKILTKLEDEYITLHKRIMLLIVGPYKDMGLECSFMVNDVKVAFKK
ncbi:exocyst complex component Sec3-domain-containing protein [Pyronema domesticum]|uniref:Similar to Exocyst complex component 1 acc. no. Q9NV70 n=1 Tax=Pyronema omphalodes (strain CBS 100304) TaxID=1076935 RepID=U4L839_PYROM|nr:exocyst complex component Sec3-domain-containing protein [Pyronema domesticum]CCX14306.1 Similar to Exocyst complex component 1; acc. no. Q9NV70 [Pyronema omphalodes CBS 100304]